MTRKKSKLALEHLREKINKDPDAYFEKLRKKWERKEKKDQPRRDLMLKLYGRNTIMKALYAAGNGTLDQFAIYEAWPS